ncbi:unnamed protein product [Cladocopium goreaui]|uniref:Translation factor GUF1 homolog, mitochondrial (Elongation factor 4 homolog) (EF-4) (GTPase GUF1 homolog) (Ribosomal back-translocase) n=1 Tax=Cladocopium goreaui TaxID=2562237 RepID=A0A9P1BSI7_9DINO|nr:unnamed protein product [Cladocopium goreaui]
MMSKRILPVALLVLALRQLTTFVPSPSNVPRVQPQMRQAEVALVSTGLAMTNAQAALATWGEGSEPGQNIDPDSTEYYNRKVLNATAICLTFAVFLFGLVVSQARKLVENKSTADVQLFDQCAHHGEITIVDDDGTPKKPTTTEPLSYSLAEKFAIVGVLETITIGSLLVFVRRSKFLQRKDLTPRQVNATLFGAFLLAPVFILIQKAYYDTLIEFRGLKPEQHSIGSYLNLSLLSPTKFHWDYEQHTNPDAKVNPTLHDSWKWHDDE